MTSTIERAVGTAGGLATGAVLGAVAAVRRTKSVHPRGVVRDAQLELTGAGPAASELLGRPGSYRALVRFSRSIGFPEPLPDLLGMAIRVLDAYGAGRDQDFLLISSADAPVAHHLFIPASDAHQRPYSSALPYAAGGARFLVGALPVGDAFDLAVAAPRGRFAAIGRLTLGDELPDAANATRFNVRENTGGGLAPTGAINRMRDLAYPMSQWAWRRTGGEARRLTGEVRGA